MCRSFLSWNAIAHNGSYLAQTPLLFLETIGPYYNLADTDNAYIKRRLTPILSHTVTPVHYVGTSFRNECYFTLNRSAKINIKSCGDAGKNQSSRTAFVNRCGNEQYVNYSFSQRNHDNFMIILVNLFNIKQP